MASLSRFFLGPSPSEPAEVRLKRLAGRHREILSWAGLGAVCLFFSQLDKAFPEKNALQIVKMLKEPAKLVLFYAEYLNNTQNVDLTLLLQNLHVIVLGLATIYWYQLYSGAVAKEAGILSDLYSNSSEERVQWDEITGSKYLPLMSVAFLALFIAACATITRLHIYFGVVFLLNIFDFVGNFLVQKNIKAFSNNKKFMPSPRNPEFSTIIRKRRIARDYWLKNEQLMRVAAFTMGNLLIFYIANLKAAHSSAWAEGIPDPVLYLGMCGLIWANERLLAIWRASRDGEIHALQEAERRLKFAAYRDEAPPGAPSPGASTG